MSLVVRCRRLLNSCFHERRLAFCSFERWARALLNADCSPPCYELVVAIIDTATAAAAAAAAAAVAAGYQTIAFSNQNDISLFVGAQTLLTQSSENANRQISTIAYFRFFTLCGGDGGERRRKVRLRAAG